MAVKKKSLKNRPLSKALGTRVTPSRRVAAVIDDQAAGGISDTILLDSIAKNDQGAFDALVERYRDRVRRLAMGVLKAEAEADDVAQDVFITVWQKRGEWAAGNAQFGTWLYRVTLNKAIDAKRMRKSTVDVDNDYTLMDRRGTGEQSYLHIEEHGNLFNLISRLPTSQRQAMIMFYFEDRPVDEISAQLASTEDGIRSLLKRGRTALRKFMTEESALHLPG